MTRRKLTLLWMWIPYKHVCWNQVLLYYDVFLLRANQEVVEEAFIPTLKTLRNAPLSSPLAEVNAENVAELLIQLTNTKLLLKNQNDTETVKVRTKTFCVFTCIWFQIMCKIFNYRPFTCTWMYTFTMCLCLQENPRHDSIAIKICNEVLSNPDSFNLKLWVKILNKLELSESNDEAFKELAVLADQMLEVKYVLYLSILSKWD